MKTMKKTRLSSTIKWIVSRSALGYTTGMLALGGSQLALAQAEPEIQEVVVTGSFIRRQDNFDTVSPVDTIDAQNIAEQGSPNIGEIIRNTTFNYGVASVTNILGSTAQGGTAPNANLRGLGANATLTVLDGRRTVSQNLSNLYPQIAVARIETLTDGGGAIFGTDAIGGVVNVIPRKNFDGFEVRLSQNQAEGGWDESTWSFIGGADNGTTSFMGAFEFRDRSKLEFMDRPEFALGAPSFSTTASPGRAVVPNRDANGNLTGTSTTRNDPGCGLNNPADGTKQQVGGFPQGINIANAACASEFGSSFNFSAESEQYLGMFVLQHEFSDYLSFESEVLFGNQETVDRGSPQNPGGRVTELPAVPGENPGNPFRAMTAQGDLLFAQPVLTGTGTLALDSLGRPIPLRDENNQVVLASNQFADLSADPNGGIPFNEDVILTNWRPPLFPQNRPDRTQSDGTGVGDGVFETFKARWVGQLNFEIPGSTWGGYATYTFDRATTDTPNRREPLSNLAAGLRGQLIVPVQGGSQQAYFNPFSTMNFTCVNRICDGSVPGSGEVQTDPAASNPTPVINQIQQLETDRTDTRLNVVDIVASGDLFTFADRTVAAAFGGQWRSLRFEQERGPIFAAGDAFIGNGAPDWEERRTVFAAFGEISIPVFDSSDFGSLDLGSLEFSGAVRSEFVDDDSVSDLDSTTRKLGFRWEIRDWVALRGTFNTAFITPSLQDLFAPPSVGINNATDRFTGDSFFMARSLGGTATLKPEEADIYNIGTTLTFLDGDLSFSFDWKEFDFDNRIVRLLPQDVLDADFANFQAWAGGNTSLGLMDWLNSGLADPNIQRDPNSGTVSLLVTPLVNAASVNWKGFDTAVSYQFEGSQLPFVNGDIGSFTAGLQATYVQEFDAQATEGGPTLKGAGRRNNATGFLPPTPRLRANARLNWTLNQHSVALIGRYTDGVKNPASEEPFGGVSAFVLGLTGVTNPLPEEIASHTEWDLQYRISLDQFLGDRRTDFEIGAINIFDSKPPAIRTLGGLETFLHDPRRRIWYVRLTQQI
ncbi:MAG: TonB-dependent receptor [Pseudomonadales bacterium]|nr:TonB-dependent receptor [Pseudomonadales bacterium]